MAEFVVAPSRSLLPLGGLDVVQAAPLSDAGLSPYHAIAVHRRALVPGSTCVVPELPSTQGTTSPAP
jgi:propanol-preferring alcohol dehydrogenase